MPLNLAGSRSNRMGLEPWSARTLVQMAQYTLQLAVALSLVLVESAQLVYYAGEVLCPLQLPANLWPVAQHVLEGGPALGARVPHLAQQCHQRRGLVLDRLQHLRLEARFVITNSHLDQVL